MSAVAQPTISPAPNARAAARTGAVTVTFGQPLAAGAANALKVFSAQRGGLRSRGNTPATVAGNVLGFAPSAFPFLSGEQLRATVTTAAPLTQPLVFQFTAAVGGQGRGSFTAPASNPEPTTGQYPTGLAFGDVDGDGDLDLLVANSNDNTVSIRSNDGTGNFTAVLPNVVVTNAPVGLVLADVDSDGDLDILTSGIGNGGLGSLVCIRKNDGTGRFITPPDDTVAVGSYASSLAVGDVDGDGDLDFFTSNAGNSTISVRFNHGTGIFSPSYTDLPVGYLCFRIAAGDLDNDGDLDLVTTSNGTNSVYLSFNNGRGGFTSTLGLAVGLSPSGIALTDVDGDADLDIVTTNSTSGTITTRLNNGQGVFTASSPLPDVPVGSTPLNLVAGDLDADGDPDLVIINRGVAGADFTTILLNSGAGRFVVASTVPVGKAPEGIALADVDGDGDLDYATSNITAQTASVRLNGGTSPRPDLRISGPATICPGPAAGITLSAAGTPTPVSYLWNTGATTSSISTGLPGTYSATALFADGQTASAQQAVVAGVAAPVVSLGRDTTLCDGTVLVLQAPRGLGLTYAWSDGSTGATLPVGTAGTYSLRVSTACGSQQASRTIAVRACLQIPTIVTANGDKRNDRFEPVGLPAGNWTLEVYSRWGQRVFQQSAYTNEWGAAAAPGVYYYQLSPANGKTAAYRGWVEVVR
ncbi:hypothetical protein GCM10022409_11450 [Hymenobacter glaciei]|uniref:SbsA Ig-like domain-containing protein n=1 Tax=Hymenobacter glaciei TaxID=877209 RepID=A0ABP7TP10_9BACT